MGEELWLTELPDIGNPIAKYWKEFQEPLWKASTLNGISPPKKKKVRCLDKQHSLAPKKRQHHALHLKTFIYNQGCLAKKILQVLAKGSQKESLFYYPLSNWINKDNGVYVGLKSLIGVFPPSCCTMKGWSSWVKHEAIIRMSCWISPYRLIVHFYVLLKEEYIILFSLVFWVASRFSFGVGLLTRTCSRCAPGSNPLETKQNRSPAKQKRFAMKQPHTVYKNCLDLTTRFRLPPPSVARAETQYVQLP